MKDPVNLVIADAVAEISFNRPEEANSIDRDTAQALLDAVSIADQNTSVRLIRLASKGRFFCAGGDLKSIAGAPAGMTIELREIANRLHTAISLLLHTDKPVLSALDGVVAGAGVGIVLSSDFVISSDRMKLSTAFNGVGLSPDSGTSWILPRLVGLRAARELILRNRLLSAHAALELGLVSQIVSVDEFGAAVESLSQELSTGPTLAYGATRRLLLDSYSRDLDSHLAEECRELVRTGGSADAAEGLDAFNSKRKARYRGR